MLRHWPARFSVWKGLAEFSGFAYLNRLAAVAFAQGDKLILGAMVSMSALTYYAVLFAPREPALLANVSTGCRNVPARERAFQCDEGRAPPPRDLSVCRTIPVVPELCDNDAAGHVGL